jgi:hypothetical protein
MAVAGYKLWLSESQTRLAVVGGFWSGTGWAAYLTSTQRKALVDQGNGYW